jgi:hypothetical protein
VRFVQARGPPERVFKGNRRGGSNALCDSVQLTDCSGVRVGARVQALANVPPDGSTGSLERHAEMDRFQ